MVKFYVLGLLYRYGPQYGYQIKKRINEQLSDFTEIKLPTIYYHLAAMSKSGLLLAKEEKGDSKPDKTVYSIADKGKKEFDKLLHEKLNFEFKPSFDMDSVFYFSEYVKREDLLNYLKSYSEKLEGIVLYIEKHKEETLKFIPDEYKTMSCIIFNHHISHYRAEKEWVEKSLGMLMEGDK